MEWHTAARAAQEQTQFHHRDAHADTLAAHHKLVMDLGRTHNWDVAMDYDIQQHDTVALNPTHDLSMMDLAALTIIATHPVVSATRSSPQSLKRAALFDSSAQTVHKKQCSHCFCCGGSDHLPADCKAEITITGKSTAKLAPSTKSKHAMLAPNGKPFCFHWACSSACSFSNTCSNFHGCSICDETSHGAGSCRSHA